ncbi:hypothetical protein ACLESD_39360, partial [Pyxidicoccus sp. 3LFB2]
PGPASALSVLERYDDAAGVLATLADSERVKGQAVLEAEVAMARADVESGASSPTRRGASWTSCWRRTPARN